MIENDLLHFGYLFVFFGVALEGDATLLTAAFLSRQGHLYLGAVVAASAFGSFAVNQAYYELARRKGETWIAGLPIAAHRLDTVRSWEQSYGAFLIVGSRFLFGFRALVPILCGASGMNPWWFALWNLAGTLLWAGTVGTVGFFGVHALLAVVLDIRHHELGAAFVIVVCSCGLIGWASWRHDWADVWKLASRRIK